MKKPADRRKKKDDIKVTVEILPVTKPTPQQIEAMERFESWLYDLAMEQMEKDIAAAGNQEEAKEDK